MLIKLNESTTEDQLMQTAEGYKELFKICDKYDYEIDIAANYIMSSGNTETEVILQLKDKHKNKFAPDYISYDPKLQQWECGVNIDEDEIYLHDLEEYKETIDLIIKFIKDLEKFDLTSLALINVNEL